MATATFTIGPADHGRQVAFVDFIEADFEDGWLYELARGVVDVTEVPGPNHGRIVMLLAELLGDYRRNHPGIIIYRAGGGECRIRLPGMVSDRHRNSGIVGHPDDVERTLERGRPVGSNRNSNRLHAAFASATSTSIRASSTGVPSRAIR